MDGSYFQDSETVGSVFWDEDARHFFELVQTLRGFCGSSQQPQAMKVLKDIEDFLAHRFAFESRVMLYNRTEDMEIHCQQHELLLQNLSCSIEQVCKRNHVDVDLCDFLTDWFQFHRENLDYQLCGLQIPVFDRPPRPTDTKTA
jgi:hemerythrin-like metal-binding protein